MQGYIAYFKPLTVCNGLLYVLYAPHYTEIVLYLLYRVYLHSVYLLSCVLFSIRTGTWEKISSRCCSVIIS